MAMNLFPVFTGVNRRLPIHGSLPIPLPRMHGGEPMPIGMAWQERSSSPYARG